MPSFDVTSELNWHELENAINQANREVTSRYDFRGLKVEFAMDKKVKTLTITCSESEKLDAAVDMLQEKMVKRGISLFFLEFKDAEPTSGRGAKKVATILNGIAKDKGKEIIKKVKDQKFKVEGQIQDEQLRFTAKSRDQLQEVIQFLKENQQGMKVSLGFVNFRD